MPTCHRLLVGTLLVFSLAVALPCAEVSAQSQPDGQLTIAFDVSIAPSFLDPAETPGIGTPFVFLYAMHDALIKPLPGNDMAACLAESWKESPDWLTYKFKLREGLKFHNGDPFTAEAKAGAPACHAAPDLRASDPPRGGTPGGGARGGLEPVALLRCSLRGDATQEAVIVETGIRPFRRTAA